jgi:hypothetical protein
MFALISSRMAACGQPPVSMARIREAGRARFLIKNSWSSRVKISFVTVADRISGLLYHRITFQTNRC